MTKSPSPRLAPLLLATIATLLLAHSPTCSIAEDTPRTTPPTQFKIHFDGIYTAKPSNKKRTYSYHLRFYPDGTVISVSTSGTPDQIRKWFDRTHAGVSTGTWTLKGTKIEFTTSTKTSDPNDQPVKVDYQGTITSDAMELSSHSHATQHKDTLNFKFSAVELSPK